MNKRSKTNKNTNINTEYENLGVREDFDEQLKEPLKDLEVPSLGPWALGLAKDKDEGSLASSGTKGGKGDTLASSASLAKGDKDEKDFECEKKWVQTTLIPDIEPEKRDFGMVCLKNVTDEEKEMRSKILDHVTRFQLEDCPYDLRTSSLFCLWSFYGKDGKYIWGFTMQDKPYNKNREKMIEKWKLGWKFNTNEDLLVPKNGDEKHIRTMSIGATVFFTKLLELHFPKRLASLVDQKIEANSQ